jgi:hypothetical protein
VLAAEEVVDDRPSDREAANDDEDDQRNNGFARRGAKLREPRRSGDRQDRVHTVKQKSKTERFSGESRTHFSLPGQDHI